ncbi:hypothetical protein L226DRAFT_260437 [Lentinus tigrinus ALCF2SS1-7]|uniref:uncharacterized protein n=1 Tax=Lentinus tigrinus ALCF2SS1-7 TaxID=1328758 RepID=UPI001165EADB|nr:hypothetical protein L226DRAFT_260437 [Lentinus tigrinus ALCF2SS1-7]
MIGQRRAFHPLSNSSKHSMRAAYVSTQARACELGAGAPEPSTARPPPGRAKADGCGASRRPACAHHDASCTARPSRIHSCSSRTAASCIVVPCKPSHRVFVRTRSHACAHCISDILHRRPPPWQPFSRCS